MFIEIIYKYTNKFYRNSNKSNTIFIKLFILLITYLSIINYSLITIN